MIWYVSSLKVLDNLYSETSNIYSETVNCALDLNDRETLLQLLIDGTAMVDTKTVSEVMYQIWRLC